MGQPGRRSRWISAGRASGPRPPNPYQHPPLKRRLFKYISGNNADKAKVEMAAPVTVKVRPVPAGWGGRTGGRRSTPRPFAVRTLLAPRASLRAHPPTGAPRTSQRCSLARAPPARTHLPCRSSSHSPTRCAPRASHTRAAPACMRAAADPRLGLLAGAFNPCKPPPYTCGLPQPTHPTRTNQTHKTNATV